MTGLDDRDIVTDCLEATKHSSSIFHKAILEAANDSIRNTFSRMHNNLLMMNKTLFDIMHQRGWYQVEPATRAQPQMQAGMPPQQPHHYQPEMQHYQGPNPNQPGF